MSSRATLCVRRAGRVAGGLFTVGSLTVGTVQELFWRMARELVLDIQVQNGGTKEEALKEGKLRKAQPNAAHMVPFPASHSRWR